MKSIVALLLFIGVLSLASAATLQLAPSQISITGFPGENLTRNISVTTSGNFTVFFNITITGNSTATDVLASMPSNLSIDGQQNIPLDLAFATDMAPAAINIKITAQAEAPDDPVLPEESSGGGGDPLATALGSTYSPSKNQILAGFTQELRTADKIKFALGAEAHSLAVNAVSGDWATITVRSNPITITLRAGEERKLNLSDYDTFDLLVKLNNITNGKAAITIKSISEKIPEQAQPEKPTPLNPPTNTTTNVTDDTLRPNPPVPEFVRILVIAALILAVVAIVIWLTTRNDPPETEDSH